MPESAAFLEAAATYLPPAYLLISTLLFAVVVVDLHGKVTAHFERLGRERLAAEEAKRGETAEAREAIGHTEATDEVRAEEI